MKIIYKRIPINIHETSEAKTLDWRPDARIEIILQKLHNIGTFLFWVWNIPKTANAFQKQKDASMKCTDSCRGKTFTAFITFQSHLSLKVRRRDCATRRDAGRQTRAKSWHAVFAGYLLFLHVLLSMTGLRIVLDRWVLWSAAAEVYFQS